MSGVFVYDVVLIFQTLLWYAEVYMSLTVGNVCAIYYVQCYML